MVALLRYLNTNGASAHVNNKVIINEVHGVTYSSKSLLCLCLNDGIMRQ